MMIIHRDLSSNNVLIIAKRNAKVTDFGMSKLIEAAPTMTPLTMCPGTLAYMPPEVLREPPRYMKKIDCFSEGVIMIQVCTRLWPEPGPRIQTIQDSRYPIGIIEMPVSETERRKNHIDMIDPTHPLLPIAMDCICFQEVKRPSSDELCQRLADLKESTQYTQNIEQQQDEMQAKDDQIVTLTQQLHERVRVIYQQQNEIMLKKSEIDDNLAEIASRERQLRQLNQQLKEQVQVTSEFQQTNHSLQNQVEQLQRELTQQKHLGQPQAPPSIQIQLKVNELQEEQSMKSKLPQQPSIEEDQMSSTLTLNWEDRGRAPFGMSCAAAVVDGNVVYFMHWRGQGCCYNIADKTWREFPKINVRMNSVA